jgi:hypothetical protein
LFCIAKSQQYCLQVFPALPHGKISDGQIKKHHILYMAEPKHQSK